MLGLAKAMAREFGPDGIRVNCVTPGLVETDITGDELTPAMKSEIIKGIPLAGSALQRMWPMSICFSRRISPPTLPGP